MKVNSHYTGAMQASPEFEFFQGKPIQDGVIKFLQRCSLAVLYHGTQYPGVILTKLLPLERATSPLYFRFYFCPWNSIFPRNPMGKCESQERWVTGPSLHVPDKRAGRGSFQASMFLFSSLSQDGTPQSQALPVCGVG